MSRIDALDTLRIVRLFIFGAGSTFGTLKLPGVKGFGRHLAALLPNWRTCLGALADVVDALEPRDRRSENDWDLDATWTHVDYVAKLHDALDTGAFPSSASSGLHAAVTEVYGRADVARVQAGYDARGSFTLAHEIDRVRPGDVVVSFNWDVVVESLLCHRFRGGPGRVIQAPSPPTRDPVLFAKPHGSLTWNRLEIDKPDTVHDGHGGPRLGPIPAWTTIMDSALRIEPFLLGAVPIKSELIAEVHKPQHSVVMKQWAPLCRAIREADDLCVLG